MRGSLPRTVEAVAAEGSEGYLLRSEDDLGKAVAHAVEQGMRWGASGAIAFASESGGMNVAVADREVKSAVRDGNQSLRVTLFEGGRTGTALTESLEPADIQRVVDQAMAMARQLELDPDAGLADPEALAWDTPTVPLFAPSNDSAADLTNAALATEESALSTPTADGLRVSEAGAASQDMRFALATSQGFCRTGSGSIQQRWCQVIAHRDGQMHQGFWSSTDRRTRGLEPEAAVGRRAAERALAMLGAGGLATRRVPVLVDSTVASSLVRDLCAQLTGAAQFRRMTFLPDAVGKDISAPHLTLREDPFEPYGLASSTFDSEGVAGERRDIVREGVVTGLFLDARMARKLGKSSTGNADGMRNLTLASKLTEPGDDLGAMLRKMDTGLWLTGFMGGGANPATGAYSRAAIGFWVENGALAGPVHGFTIAGNLREMLRAIVAIGADVHREGAIRSGSILLPEMQVAGR